MLPIIISNNRRVGVARSGFLYNKNWSEWLGVDFCKMKMGRSGFLYNKNGSEWLGVDLYLIEMGRSGLKWIFI